MLPPLYPILDTATLERLGMSPTIAAEAFLDVGASILQFRHKTFWSREVFAEAARVAALCQSAGAIFIVNDRADYARILDAGLHLGQEDLLPADARKVIGPAALLGFSTHNPEQMRAAQAEPVDYVAFGPVFSTQSKDRADPVVGLDALRTMRALTNKPLVAIGGITRGNAQACRTAGADSLAVIADLFPAPCTPQNLRARMREWLTL